MGGSQATEGNSIVNFKDDKCHFTVVDNGRGFIKATINYGIGLKKHRVGNKRIKWSAANLFQDQQNYIKRNLSCFYIKA